MTKPTSVHETLPAIIEESRVDETAITADMLRSIMGDSTLVPVETGFEAGRRRQEVPVRVLRGLGEAAEKTVIVPLMAITDEPARKEVCAHNATIAAHTGATVLSAGNLGVEYRGWRVTSPGSNRLTAEQRQSLAAGDFGPAAAAVAGATASALEHEGLEDHDVILLAPSLAASIASAGMRYFIERMNLRGVVMLDPVGFAQENGLKRMGQFFSVLSHANDYLAANHSVHRGITESTGFWAKRSVDSLGPNILYGLRGVAAGTMGADLERQAGVLSEAGVHLHALTGERSEFGTAEPTGAAIDRLRGLGVNATHIPVKGARHAMVMMAGLHAMAAERLIGEINQQAA